MTPPKHKERPSDFKQGWLNDIQDLVNNRLGLLLLGLCFGGSSWTAIYSKFGDKTIHVSKIDTVITDMDQLDKDFKAYQTLDMKEHQDLNGRIDAEDQRITHLTRRNHLVTLNP